MVKLWGGYGKRAANRSGRAANRNGRGADREDAAAYRNVRAADKGREGAAAAAASNASARPLQHNIIDFETLMSWYNEQNSGEALAAGNEWSDAYKIAQKQANLKFMLL